MSKSSRLFRNALVFTFADGWTPPDIAEMESFMDKLRFMPTGPTQQQSLGWVPPRGGEFDPLVESIDGQLILKVRCETRKVPSAAVNAKVDERAKAIEEEFGRRPGKKERKELKEQVTLEMLPNAIPSNKVMVFWIDRENNRIVFDATGYSLVDDVITMLVTMFTDLNNSIMVRPLSCKTSPTAAMSAWLLDSEQVPGDFTVDRDAVLKSADESKAAVRYSSHPLDINEVRDHVRHGKLPTQLAMTYDDRVSFVLTDSLVLKNLEALDTVFDGADAEGGFDADIALITGELVKVLNAVIEALDGLFVEPAVGEGLPATLVPEEEEEAV